MKSEKMHNWLIIILGVVASLTWIYPFVLIFINSFKTRREIFTNTLFWPNETTTENYPRAYEDLNYTESFMNSLMITVASIIVIVLFSSMSAYALSRYPGKMSSVIYFICAITMLIPFQSLMIPLVSLFGRFDMLNRVGLTFMNLGFGSSMSIFLYFGALRSVPKSLDEAAILDGANPFQIFWRVVFPLLKPTTVTVIILNSIRIWNDYLLPSLVINKDGMYTIPLQMYYFFGQYTIQWELALAGLVLAIIPIILLYMFLQKHIIQGITEGATK
ncbi:MAG: carbohydrate ABC transporter permease [Desemzia incerta]|uniref:Raffinose/stachyose/melibiose transport system permease protein n=1 Tax=Desemzia incerta TaxID=82801 RepID=A0A1I5X914_9LACT|nr:MULTISPECIES: carbohydrate ABC transporter permease [Desemzia]MCI3028696.1 carbohydrate ABC transporter permease [Desemzia sp. C1]SFQ28127.1 raffinose/stachyose/melibiose transport system permease protein [Desemzia incerta]